MREGRLSLDQVGVIAARAGEGSDEHYAAAGAQRDGQPTAHRRQVGTATQIRSSARTTAARSPRPPTTSSPVGGSNSRTLDAAKFDAALQSHRDALIAEWKRDHDKRNRESDHRPPLPGTAEAFMRLVEAGWDAEVARRPHGHHTTVVVHLDVKQRAAALHLGPLLTEAERRYLTCDATCEVWFERDGQVIGAGRATRLINRRLRRALEHRHPTCAVPGVVPPAVCTHTTSGTGKTAAPPNWPTWCWSAPITTGCTIEASSPSPDPCTTSPSLTAPAENSALDHWRAHRRNPRPPWHRAPALVASAPTGGGTNHSNRNHHRLPPDQGDLTGFVARLPDHQRGALGHDRDIATLLGAQPSQLVSHLG